MKLVTENEAVSTFRALADMACSSHEPVFIAREGASPVVLIALADYESRNDTEYLLSSPANAARLMEAVAAYETKQGYRERELIEP
jgi:antitoxin YefM